MEQASLRLMVALKKRGHELELLSLHPLGGLSPLLNQAGVPATGLPYAGRGGWRIFRQLRQRLQHLDADALLMTGHHFLALMALGKKPVRRVLAIHFHHSGVKPDWQWRLFYRLAVSKFTAITFPSDFVRGEAESLYPPLKERTCTVRYPLALPRTPDEPTRAKARRELKLPSDCFIIGNAGWLIPRKRWDVFLETAALVIKQHPRVHFVVAGDGPLQAELARLASALGLTDHVSWLGWQTDLTMFYQAVDLLLFNSDWDALAVTPQEALSHGVPVVASSLHGGLAEIVQHDRDGFLLAEHDTEALAAEILRLIRDPAARQARALAGRQRIREMCDPDAIARCYEELLQPELSPGLDRE